MTDFKGNILIVEDEALVAANYSDHLEPLGYHCRIVNNVAQALTIIKMESFNLLICDHDLPDGKGIDLITALRNLGWKTPVCYLSAAQNTVLKEIQDLAEISVVLSKPVDKEDLCKAVEENALDEIPNQPSCINTKEREMLSKVFPFCKS